MGILPTKLLRLRQMVASSSHSHYRPDLLWSLPQPVTAQPVPFFQCNDRKLTDTAVSFQSYDVTKCGRSKKTTALATLSAMCYSFIIMNFCWLGQYMGQTPTLSLREIRECSFLFFYPILALYTGCNKAGNINTLLNKRIHETKMTAKCFNHEICTISFINTSFQQYYKHRKMSY